MLIDEKGKKLYSLWLVATNHKINQNKIEHDQVPTTTTTRCCLDRG
jgi:hypothetical protein